MPWQPPRDRRPHLVHQAGIKACAAEKPAAEKPTAETVPSALVADPCAMVIFGAAGDLTKRKLMPALLNLRRGGLLSDRLAIVAVARTEK